MLEGLGAIVLGLYTIGLSAIALLPVVSKWQAEYAARWQRRWSVDELEDVYRSIAWFGVWMGLGIMALGVLAVGRAMVDLVAGSPVPWLAGPVAVLLVVLALYVGTAVFERVAPRPAKRTYQRTVNRFGRLILGLGPGWAVIETTGRRSREPRRVPVGGKRVGDSFWLVAGDGHHSAFVLNIESDPRVRVKLGGRWRTGTAHLLPDDDPVARLWRLNKVNGLFVRIASSHRTMLTVRIDLAPS